MQLYGTGSLVRGVEEFSGTTVFDDVPSFVLCKGCGSRPWNLLVVIILFGKLSSGNFGKNIETKGEELFNFVTSWCT